MIPADGRPSRLSSADLLLGLTAAAAALALYVRTLQPDFGGPEDTPKFQFLGYVLGTAHPPGYPLYVLLSHPFVRLLPFGSVAWRANLFSAVMAAIACGCVVLIARRLGVRRVVAVACAAALATGASFWRSAVYAEVYSLAAVIVAASVLCLLTWDARRRLGWLLAAIAVLASGLGNHLTILGVVPAFVVFVLVRERRAVTPRFLALATLIVLAGLAQYWFIVIRTLQGGVYLESQATNLAQLVAVIRADRFSDMRFAFTPAVLLREHLPVLLDLIRAEITAIGAVLLIIGLGAAARARVSAGALIAGAAAGMLAMILNMSGDLKGFITPVMVLLWPLVALGIEGVLKAFGGRATVLAVLAIALPVVNITRNFSAADQRQQTEAARFLRVMFGQLPEGAAFVAEDYWSDMAFEYYRTTGESGPMWGIERLGLSAGQVRTAARRGQRVFALGAGATILATDGLWFSRVRLPGVPLAEWVRSLPRGTLLVGASALAPVPLDPSSVGRADARPRGRPRTFESFAFITGEPQQSWQSDDNAVQTGIPDEWKSRVGSIAARADAAGARIELNAETISRVISGLTLAAFDKDGSLLRTLEFNGSSGEVEFQAALYELRSESPCIDVSAGEWKDVTAAFADASVLSTLNELGTSTMEIEIAGLPEVDSTAAALFGDGGSALKVSRAKDATTLTWTITRTGERRPAYRLALDRIPSRVRARIATGASPVRLCAYKPAVAILTEPSGGVLRADFEHEAYFGAGWGPAERTPTGPIRRTNGAGTLLLPPAPTSSCRLIIDGTAGVPIEVSLNGTMQGRCELRSGSCEVELRDGMRVDARNSVTLSTGSPAIGAKAGHALAFRAARLICGGLK